VIEHIAEYRVLYCHLCKQVCFPSSLHTHLFEIHNVKAAIRRPNREAGGIWGQIPGGVGFCPGEIALGAETGVPNTAPRIPLGR
jgi:hypothetical protein